ncbi:MAG: aspartate/glutamate racemase family protein [Polaromonas sp.]|nr:aspartate/glutamate racemase family protein [Polaromonas sp.]
MPSKRPIGVFDSGIGGLSILKALRAELPHESFIYIADSGNAPYGEKGDAFVIDRSRAITRSLINDYGVKAWSSHATRRPAAAKVLRDEFPVALGRCRARLKPAIRLSQTRKIGVIATRGTLESAKFAALKESLADQADFIIQPCDGLASAIEAQDATKIIALLASYMPAIGQFGIENCNVDTLVLGCTHYPFISPLLRQYTGDAVHLIDTGVPVAAHTKRILANLNQLTDETQYGQLQLLSTGPARHHTLLAHEWLNVPNQFEMITI